LIQTLLRRTPDCELRLAFKPTHVLLWSAMAGASIKEIQELAGHKTTTMSARYSHLSPGHRLSVINRIATETL
jgi:site-specific recombinase XerD